MWDHAPRQDKHKADLAVQRLNGTRFVPQEILDTWDEIRCWTLLDRVCTWERSGEISRLIKQSAWPQECCVSHLISVFLNWAEFSHRHWPPPPTGGPPLVGPLLSKRRFPASRGQANRTKRPLFLVRENSRTNSWRLDANNLFQQRGRRYLGLEKHHVMTQCSRRLEPAGSRSRLHALARLFSRDV